MISGALPKVTFRKPPMPGPEHDRQLLGGLPHQRRRRDHAGRRAGEDHGRLGVRELERDGDRDERHEEVRPPIAAEGKFGSGLRQPLRLRRDRSGFSARDAGATARQHRRHPQRGRLRRLDRLGRLVGRVQRRPAADRCAEPSIWGSPSSTPATRTATVERRPSWPRRSRDSATASSSAPSSATSSTPTARGQGVRAPARLVAEVHPVRAGAEPEAAGDRLRRPLDAPQSQDGRHPGRRLRAAGAAEGRGKIRAYGRAGPGDRRHRARRRGVEDPPGGCPPDHLQPAGAGPRAPRSCRWPASATSGSVRVPHSSGMLEGKYPRARRSRKAIIAATVRAPG